MGLAEVLFWPFAFAFVGVLAVFAILFIIFWIWMIVDCAKRKFKNSAEKVIWILVIVFLHWIGSVVYFIVVKMYNQKGIFKR